MFQQIALKFAEAPHISHPLRANASYNEGSAVDLICTATGTPDPDVEWIRDGQVKSSGPKTAQLKFSNISKSDAGMYTCKASNSIGSEEKQLKLVVNCKYYELNQSRFVHM